MVKVELVADGVNVEAAQDPRIVEKAEAVSDDEEWVNDEDEDDDFDTNETLAERIAALKDVIPPQYRAKVLSSLSSLTSWAQSAANFGGKSVWVLTSSTLLLGVPLALCILSEQQLMEMEKGMTMGESDEVLAYGTGEQSA